MKEGERWTNEREVMELLLGSEQLICSCLLLRSVCLVSKGARYLLSVAGHRQCC